MTLSFETVKTGKMDVRVYRIQEDDYKHEVREPTELRAYVELLYHLPYEEIAQNILDNYLGTVRVEVTDWNYNGIVKVK